MKLESIKYLITLLMAAAFLAGCSSSSTKDDVVEEPAVSTTETTSGTTAAPEKPEVDQAALAAQRAQEAAEREQAALREVRTFYFDFDHSSLQSEASPALAAHAAYLSANPSMKIVLEGHCDERGTKEYNIALGESRAKSVATFLAVNGVSPSQIEVISYGEEKPAASGTGENAWAKNRRVYLDYK